ncbi:hypothetical protein D9C73_007853 [Collichthys lucidus]|uniref:Uncharacterized protein n=1 Tax=Collichthys lucidus TaxID=240159 RepID=A0A4V6AQ23_COLLU|nr:hypothetical protein D9C73_007853 [Collichthys lucidus]
MTRITAKNMVEEDSHPSPLSETQMDDATGANNSPQQKKFWTVMRKTGASKIPVVMVCIVSKAPLKKKKTPWQQTEVQAVERHMNRFITSCVVPGKSDCEKCLKAEPEALKNRDWQNL